MIPIDLDIDMLRCFAEVARTRSFTKAGNNIGLTQSGVSIKIRRLEERLNSPVFNRASKPLALTLEGEILLDYAKRILTIHEEAVCRLTRPKASGNLNVGIIDYFIPEHIPDLLNKFRKQYPRIHLRMQTGFGTDLIPLFEKGELDLVVAGIDSYQGPYRILTEEPLVWVIGNGTEIPENEPIHLALLPSPCSFREYATEGLKKANREWEVLFTGTSIANIQAAVQAGIGLSVLPKGALRSGLKVAPAYLNLPELPIYSIALILDEQKQHEARDVFISYLEAAIQQGL